MGVVERQNYLFLAVSCGYFVNKKKEMSVGAYEGSILGIKEVEDEFEGNKVAKVEVKMQDNASPEIAIIKFTMESWYSIGFFARIQKIDVKKPFIIGVMPSDKNEKLSFCYLKQAGQEKIEANKEFPKPKKVTISKKEVLDWSEPIELMQKIITEITAKLPQAPAVATPAVITGTEAPAIVETTGDDDLPF